MGSLAGIQVRGLVQTRRADVHSEHQHLSVHTSGATDVHTSGTTHVRTSGATDVHTSGPTDVRTDHEHLSPYLTHS